MAAAVPEPRSEEERRALRHLHRLELARRRMRRAVLSLIAVGIVLVIGTVGFALITGSGWINAFYFESMLATGQGPPTPLATNGAKLFAAGMAFLSVGTVVTTLLLNIGPILGRIWREGLEAVEREMRWMEHELVHGSGPRPPAPPA